jgi:hemoglobin-like flavoprotein
MTPEQIADIRRTWAMVTPIADAAAVLFYDRLFAIDPATKPLFRRTDMAAQRATLMGTLALVVKGIDGLDRLVPIVENLGRRHAGYGVIAQHYISVGSALMWTLAQGLGPEFTPSVRDAWANAYGILATVMQDAAAREADERRGGAGINSVASAA